MEIKAKVISVLPLVTGTSARGEWKKQEVVISWAEETYEKKLCVSASKANMDKMAALTVGGEYIFHCNTPSSREANGRWFTSVECWKIESSSPF